MNSLQSGQPISDPSGCPPVLKYSATVWSVPRCTPMRSGTRDRPSAFRIGMRMIRSRAEAAAVIPGQVRPRRSAPVSSTAIRFTIPTMPSNSPPWTEAIPR